MNFSSTHCTLCPRACGANRIAGAGACGAAWEMRVAQVMLHFFEEPPISGTRGSGAIFFAGCSLRCGYCQNAPVSQGEIAGKAYTPHALAQEALRLQEEGAHNINLVTAGHFLPRVIEFLQEVKPQLKIPVVYNSSGYERAEAIAMLEGLVDIYLPDYKYIDPAAAARYSGAADYPQAAEAAIAEMVRQTGAYREKDGLAVRGTIIRHLVLPSFSRDGARIMRVISQKFPDARVSIMRQYTPSFNRTGDSALDRRITTLEYNRVVNAAVSGGLQGFTQERDCADEKYTPLWEE